MTKANAFGVQFQTCSEEQKAKLEAVFRDACNYEKEHGEFKGECTCDLLIALLSPDAPRGAAIVAAWEIARGLHSRRQAEEFVGELLQAARPPMPKGRAN